MKAEVVICGAGIAGINAAYALAVHQQHIPGALLVDENAPVPGAFVIGALSGFGLMAAGAAGELLARVITQSSLPAYAPAFALERYANPGYPQMLAHWNDSGHL